VTLVLLIDSLTSILSTFLAGSLADRFGRKGVMVFSLFTFGLVYILITQAQTIEMFAVLMGLRGLVMPLYSVGADAMVADLIVEKQRAEAYSLLRMVNNAGIAIGPVVGGFVAAASFASAFLVAAASLILFSFLVFFAMRETLPRLVEHTVPSAEGGYLRVFKDRFYLGVVAGFTMVGMASSLMFVLFSVYAEKNYGLPKPEIGLMMTINALMVVFFQLAVTRFTRRFPPLRVMTLGALFYGLGVGSIALGQSFPAFALSMVVMTCGELILVPTSTTLAANLAPVELRGRYLGVYGLGWGISHGLGPVVGGLLNDRIAPVAIWYGGLAWGLLSALVFAGLGVAWKNRANTATAQISKTSL
jgi:MFS family permease